MPVIGTTSEICAPEMECQRDALASSGASWQFS
jgi:hypothetical protein